MEKKTTIQYISENIDQIYTSINSVVLQNIAKIDLNYLKERVNALANDDKQVSNINNYKDIKRLPYFLLTQLTKEGKFDYTALRVDTIDFKKLDAKALVYYNYAQFILKGNTLYINLIQTKTGGMPIKNDIIKYTHKIMIET